MILPPVASRFTTVIKHTTPSTVYLTPRSNHPHSPEYLSLNLFAVDSEKEKRVIGSFHAAKQRMAAPPKDIKNAALDLRQQLKQGPIKKPAKKTRILRVQPTVAEEPSDVPGNATTEEKKGEVEEKKKDDEEEQGEEDTDGEDEGGGLLGLMGDYGSSGEEDAD